MSNKLSLALPISRKANIMLCADWSVSELSETTACIVTPIGVIRFSDKYIQLISFTHTTTLPFPQTEIKGSVGGYKVSLLYNDNELIVKFTDSGYASELKLKIGNGASRHRIILEKGGLSPIEVYRWITDCRMDTPIKHSDTYITYVNDADVYGCLLDYEGNPLTVNDVNQVNNIILGDSGIRYVTVGNTISIPDDSVITHKQRIDNSIYYSKNKERAVLFLGGYDFKLTTKEGKLIILGPYDSSVYINGGGLRISTLGTTFAPKDRSKPKELTDNTINGLVAMIESTLEITIAQPDINETKAPREAYLGEYLDIVQTINTDNTELGYDIDNDVLLATVADFEDCGVEEEDIGLINGSNYKTLALSDFILTGSKYGVVYSDRYAFGVCNLHNDILPVGCCLTLSRSISLVRESEGWVATLDLGHGCVVSGVVGNIDASYAFITNLAGLIPKSMIKVVSPTYTNETMIQTKTDLPIFNNAPKMKFEMLAIERDSLNVAHSQLMEAALSINNSEYTNIKVTELNVTYTANNQTMNTTIKL